MFTFNLHGDEELVKMQRQSELVLSGPVILVMSLIYVPAAFLIKYDLFFTYRWIMFFWSFVLLLYFANKYLLWLLNCYIITTKRVIIVVQRSLFSKDVTEAPLNTVQNIKYVTRGLAGLIGLGDVQIKSSGLTELLILKNQSRPNDMKDFLWKHIEQPEKKPEPEKPKSSFTQVVRPVVYVGSKPKKTV